MGRGWNVDGGKEVLILTRMNIDGIADEVAFGQMTEIKVMEQAMWT